MKLRITYSGLRPIQSLNFLVWVYTVFNLLSFHFFLLILEQEPSKKLLLVLFLGKCFSK
jgi:hypothetical protein